MIDLQKEAAISLTAATRLPELRRDGRPPHLATLFRWCSRGITRHGRTIRLEIVQHGGSKCTTREAIARFFAALSGETVPERDHGRDHVRDERELVAMGL
jgi:hypothetical protein